MPGRYGPAIEPRYLDQVRATRGIRGTVGFTRGTKTLVTLVVAFAVIGILVVALTNGNFNACAIVVVIAAIILFFGWTQDWYMDQTKVSGRSRRRKERKERRKREREERSRRAQARQERDFKRSSGQGLTVSELEARELK